jgi:hypothetical protein
LCHHPLFASVKLILGAEYAATAEAFALVSLLPVLKVLLHFFPTR